MSGMEWVMRFANKVVAVTGGQAGIGKATVERFVEEGARVASLDLYDEVPAPSQTIVAIRCDVGISAEIDAAFERIKAELGDVDVLVNNAGILSYHTVVDTDEEEWDRVMAVNVKAAYLCARRAVPMMQRR